MSKRNFYNHDLVKLNVMEKCQGCVFYSYDCNP